MINYIKQQWFLIGLILVCLCVVFDPTSGLEVLGKAIKDLHGTSIIIFSIFIISGLMLDGEQIKTGIGDIKATLCALIVIVIFAPLCGLMLYSFVPSTDIVVGLFIVAVMPTTLSSGVVMTHKAGGNLAHALFVTIISNITAIFSIPIVLAAILSFIELNVSLTIDKSAIMVKLGLLVLFPLFLGLVLKALFLKKVDMARFKLSIVNQSLILSMVFISVASAKQVLVGKPSIILTILILVAVFHLILLAMAFGLIKLTGLPKTRFESVLFMGAQKTLPLSVMIQVTYFADYGTALLVCVFHHIVHLLIDGYLSTRLGRKTV